MISNLGTFISAPNHFMLLILLSYRNKKSKGVFARDKRDKMPLIVLGSGMNNKSHVKFHSKMVDAVGNIVEQLNILLTDEYMSSQ